MKFWIYIILFFSINNFVFGQNDGLVLFEVKERFISETKWRYTSMVQKESGLTIHKANEDYNFLLYFRYDYTTQQYLNGNLVFGNWELENNILKFQYKNLNAFKIKYVDKNKLILEFKQGKNVFQYHYQRARGTDLPFERPQNELPTVNVKENVSFVKKWIAALTERKSKKAKKRNKKSAEDQEYVSIELIGGGYYGGIDPVYRDYIKIKTDGRLISEYKSKSRGLIKKDFKVPREQIVKIAEFALKHKYFDLPRIYECESLVCNKRVLRKPKPIPLRLSIAYGIHRKVITINVYGQDNFHINYLEYPPVLDELIESIRGLAHSNI